MKSESPIFLRGVVKHFGDTKALDDLSLVVDHGEVHGFLGPNGSGKSTTLRVLLGLLRVTSGEVRLLGGDPWADAVELHKRVAYVPGEVNLWPNLSGGEAIDLLGRLHGGIESHRRAELLERFKLDPGKRFDSYSKGNRQKVALVAALAVRAELYLLDEPTSGLDPLMEEEFRKVVKELSDDGATILLSSHILAEVEALCDRVTIIREGKTVESGSLKEMRHLSRTSVRVESSSRLEALADLPGVSSFQIEDSVATFNVDADNLNLMLSRLVAIDVRSIVCSPPTLEELFMRHYRDVKEPV